MMYQGGFIRTIILVIILIAVLSYFGFNIRNFIEGESFQTNWNYAWNAVKNVWNKYLAGPANYLWNDIFIDLIWDSFVENLQKIKIGDDTNIIEQAPQLPEVPNSSN